MSYRSVRYFSPKSKRRFFRILDQMPECAYCGFPADCRDHFLPWSKFESPYVLDACHACNQSLRARIHGTFGGRCREIAYQLRKRNAGLLRCQFAIVSEGTTGELRRKLVADWMSQLALMVRLDRLDHMGRVGDSVRLDRLMPGSDDAKRLEAILSSAPESSLEVPDIPEFSHLVANRDG